MATIRPIINEEDGYIQRVIKYIPAEIVAGYMALGGYLAVEPNAEIPAFYKGYYISLLAILTIITPVWTYFAVIDSEAINKVVQRKKAIFHALIALLAFEIWVYAIGNDILKAIICSCTNAGCQNCALYSPVLASIILVLFTIATPLLERIVLGTKLPYK